MCRVQETLSKHSEVDPSSENQALASAVEAFKRKRLTFAWLDGEKQKVVLFFRLFDLCFLLFVVLKKISHHIGHYKLQC